MPRVCDDTSAADRYTRNRRGSSKGAPLKEADADPTCVRDADFAPQLLPKHDDPVERSGLIMPLLHPDFHDATLVVPVNENDAKEYGVHLCLVTLFTHFFRAALCGKFSEARERRLVLQDTTPEAVEFAIAYMYSREEGRVQVLEKNMALALEVWKLAHMLQMDHLRKLAASGVIVGLTVDNSVGVLDHAMLYGTDEETECILNYISRHLRKVKDIEQLSVDHFGWVLSSPDLIAHENEKFRLIVEWVSLRRAERLKHLKVLLQSVKMQRYPYEERHKPFAHEDVPREWLSDSIAELGKTGFSLELPGLMNGVSGGGVEYHFKAFKKDIIRTRGGFEEVHLSQSVAFRFTFEHWALSALLAHENGKGLFLYIRFDHRIAGDENMRLEADCWRHTFRLHAQIKGELYSEKTREWDHDVIEPIRNTLVFNLLYPDELPDYFASMDAPDNTFKPIDVVFRLQCGKVPPRLTVEELRAPTG